MKNLGKSILCGIVAMFALSILAAAPSSIGTQIVPDTINYQGYLANPSTGDAYTDGIYDIQCRLYRQASGGTAIWGAQYSVYVKDGYFNIMLGDSSSSTVKSTVSGSGSTTYGKDEIWKALWYDSSASDKKNLWLGVTPLQSASHAVIASPSEISPRQQLLVAPFAFRAQWAQSANESAGNFTVNGNLTVSGSVSFPSSYNLGSYLSVSASTAKFGGASNSSSNPSTYLYGNYLYGYGYNGVSFSSSAGNITFSTPASKSMQFNTGAFAVTNSNEVSLKSRRVTLDGSAYYGVTIKGYPPAQITTDANVVITGSYNYVQAHYNNYITSGGNLWLQPATNADIRAQGHLYWQPSGYGSAAFSPIKIKNVEVTLSANNASGSMTFSTDNAYRWTIGGCIGKTIPSTAICGCKTFWNGSGWTVQVTRDSTGFAYSSSATYTVTLVGYLKEITNDGR